MAWSYQRESGFDTKIPEGNHRVRIRSTEMAVSKNGNEMIVLQLDVSGYNETLYFYIVNNEYANRNLTQLFNSFKDIPEGELNINKWVGKVGGCKVRHEEYNGNMTSKVHYFISQKQQEDLPPWKEPQRSGGGSTKPLPPADADGFMTADGLPDLPF